MSRLVWMTEWEFACCGAPFAIGERVEWTAVQPADGGEWFRAMLGDELAERIVAVETHHELDGTERRLTGRVVSIRAVLRETASTVEDPVRFRDVPGSATFLELDRLDRLDAGVEARLAAERFVTLLDGSPVAPAEEDVEALRPLFEGAGFAAAVRRGPHPARRSRGVAGYLVELD